MRIAIIVARLVSLAFFISLTACYGTKVPPPQSSTIAPPGLSNIAPGPSDFALPSHLPDLLLVYHQWLIDQNHHISPQVAQRHADTEIQLLTQEYSGRDKALVAAIKHRIQRWTPKPDAEGNQIPAGVYPSDFPQTTREGQQ